MSAGAMPPIDPAQQQPQAPPSGPPAASTDRATAIDALVNATYRAATDSAAAQDSREAKDYLLAALAGAQAIVALDPGLISPQGVPADVMAAATPQQQATASDAQAPPVAGS